MNCVYTYIYIYIYKYVYIYIYIERERDMIIITIHITIISILIICIQNYKLKVYKSQNRCLRSLQDALWKAPFLPGSGGKTEARAFENRPRIL